MARLAVCVDFYHARPGTRQRILEQARWVAAMLGGKATLALGGRLLYLDSPHPKEAARWLRDTMPPGHEWRVTLEPTA